MSAPLFTPNIIEDQGVVTGYGFSQIYVPQTEYDFPFLPVDDVTFIARQRYLLDKAAYWTKRRRLMNAVAFPGGTAYCIRPGAPRDNGNGLYDITDVFGSLPVTRSEYGTYSFTQQWIESIADTGADPSKYFYDVTWDITEQCFTIPCRTLYEYSLFTKPTPLLKQRAFMVFGRAEIIGSGPLQSGEIVADDSTIRIYGGQIYERKTVLVTPTPSTPKT